MEYTIMLKGREIPLVYTTYEMKVVQEEIAPLGELQYVLFGRNKDDETDTRRFGNPEQLEAVAKLIRIMGNAGMEEAGKDPDLTDKKVMRAIRPSEIADMINTCMNVMTDAMSSEIPEKKQEGPVDVTLEEMNKKKEKEG